ncbi:hypothetical protein CA85_05300 [Allorhodopirellula solitaria]|uniref:Uncharacterized protein n=2 Tax=Allorhodopirellula solitaria TaxID=2527987 RepID=A0A5C5YK66_9BACT|nr:hypothetical protein CA85_05300 [Allorhodopirellula solitaria]
MTWFTKLTGIDEESPDQVRRMLSVEGEHLICAGGTRIAFGKLETPKLSNLRQSVADLNLQPKRSTIYRNYFAPVNDSIGQSEINQIDCSSDLGNRLGNDGGELWTMRNGYLFPSDDGLGQIEAKLQNSSEDERNDLRGQLRIGLQWQADVTLSGASHRVSQAYCSALPVAYGRQPTDQWTDFAKLILDAAYEATFGAAVLNAARSGNPTLYLTLLGGGVFGNRDNWITAAIERAFNLHRKHGLDVRIVSHGRSQPAVTDLIHRISQSESRP